MLYPALLLIALSLSSSSLALPPDIKEHFIKELSPSKIIDISPIANNAGSYLSDVLLAKRIAACLHEFGGQLKEIHNELVSEQFQCQGVSAFDNDRCNETDKKIYAECQSLDNSKKRHGNRVFKSAGVFCEAFEANRSNPENIYQNYAILKWTQGELQNNDEKPSAYVLLVEEIQNNQTKWRSITQNLQGLSRLELNNPELGSTYQWLITAVSEKGIEDCIKTEVYSPILGKKPPGPPRNVSIDQQPNGNHTVNVLLQWDPPREKTCEYKITLDKEVKSSLANVEVIRIKEPTGTHTQWFYNLQLGKVYNVRITSRASHLNSFESNATQLKFKTKSCYELYDIDLTVCAPPIPEGLQARNLLSGRATGGGAALEIEWLSPDFQNLENSIDEYIIELKSLSPAPPMKPRAAWTFRVPGNKTKEVVGEGISAGVLLQIDLRAKSKGGLSPAAILYFKVSGDSTVPNTTKINGRIVPPITALFSENIAITMPVLGVGILFVAFVGFFWCHFEADQTEFNEIELQQFDDNNYGEGNTDSTIFSGTFTKQKWEIPSSKLEFKEKLGKGTFAIVYLANLEESLLSYKFQLRSHPYPNEIPSSTNKQQKRLVAVKAIQILGNKSGFSKEDVMREIRIMQNLEPHPNIVALFGACQDGHQIGLVIEYCPGGSVLSFLRALKEKAREGFMDPLYLVEYSQRDGASTEADEDGYCVPKPGNNAVTPEEFTIEEDSGMVFRLKLSLALSYAKQIALGMEHLAKARVVHRDLACRNILLMTGNFNCKVGDFGLSRNMDLENYYQGKHGIMPVRWTALESMFHATFTTKSDVWSYGILLWELMTLGSTPYKQICNHAILDYISHGNRLNKPCYCPEKMYSLMSNCWKTKEEKRPSFTEMIKNLDAMQLGEF